MKRRGAGRHGWVAALLALTTCAPPAGELQLPVSPAVTAPEIRIGLIVGSPALEVGSDSGAVVQDADGTTAATIAPGAAWRVRPSAGAIDAGPPAAWQLMGQRLVTFVPRVPGGLVRVGSRPYRGRVTVARDRTGITVVNVVSLEEYLAGVRRIEEQIQKYERFRAPEPGKTTPPAGIPDDYPEHLALMYDLLAVAFQTDSTRVVSFAVAPEGANQPMPHLGIAEGYHFLTHHAGNREKVRKVAKIERWYMEQFARFLTNLDAMKEADGTSVLDNAMIVYGCAIGDGNKHNHDELPVVLAGGGGGALRPGRHLMTKSDTPMTNLFVSLLRRMGVKAERVGDSTGVLDDV